MSVPNWHENLIEDPYWGADAFEGASRLTPSRNRLLRTKIVDPGLICTSGGNVYIFLTTINRWSIICSKQSTVFLNNLMGIENATVKYGDALEPYIEFLEMEAADKVATRIPQSICIGTWRLHVRLDEGKTGLEFEEIGSLLPHLPQSKSMVSHLCYMALSVRHRPARWSKTELYPMYRFLSPLFTDPTELTTIEWVAGNAMIDPHSFSKAVVLFGEGGHGKSTFLACLNIAFLGCCGTIPDQALVSLSKGMGPKVASTVVSNRIVTAGDVGNINENTNLSVIKSITGHDYISIPPSRARSACTLFYASNRLDDPTKNEEWLTPAIMRRVVVVMMNAIIPDGLDDTIPQDPIARQDFVYRCIHTRLTFPHMPVSAMSVVLTIVGSKFAEISKFLSQVDDDEIEDEHMIIANNLIASVVLIGTSEVGKLARRISPMCVRQVGTEYYIKNIEPSEFYWSMYGGE